MAVPSSSSARGQTAGLNRLHVLGHWTRLARVPPESSFTQSFQRRRALEILRRFGWNATSFQILQAQFELWFDSTEACVAYVDTGSAWVVAGSPIAASEHLERVACNFVDAARDRRRRVVFFGTDPRFARVDRFKSICIGREPIFDAHVWPSFLRRKVRIREQLRRANAKGLHAEQLDTARLAADDTLLRREIEGLIQRWLLSKPMPKMGFLTGIEPFSFSRERRYFLAKVADRIVGFAAMIPVYERRGWLLENLVRAPDAPNGTSETLMDLVMREAARTTSGYLSLGLTPLAGDVGLWLNFAKRLGAPLYNFSGLEEFRRKFLPSSWSPMYVTYPSDRHAPWALYDSLVAFARGGLFGFGLRTLARRIQPVFLPALSTTRADRIPALPPARVSSAVGLR